MRAFRRTAAPTHTLEHHQDPALAKPAQLERSQQPHNIPEGASNAACTARNGEAVEPRAEAPQMDFLAVSICRPVSQCVPTNSAWARAWGKVNHPVRQTRHEVCGERRVKSWPGLASHRSELDEVRCHRHSCARRGRMPGPEQIQTSCMATTKFSSIAADEQPWHFVCWAPGKGRSGRSIGRGPKSGATVVRRRLPPDASSGLVCRGLAARAAEQHEHRGAATSRPGC